MRADLIIKIMPNERGTLLASSADVELHFTGRSRWPD